jgi:DNA-binding response OmpR family regulator
MTALVATRTVRLAAVDTDTSFTLVVRNRAEGLGWEFRIFEAPPLASELVALRLNALLVDIALLGPSAWDWLERTCAELPDLPVIVVTGSSSVAQRIRGLRLGADDWVTKPAHPEEVLARVEAVVRRRRRATLEEAAGPIQAGDLEIRADRFQAYVGGQSADLTRREYEVLQLLADATGRVLEREEIYQRVWGYAMARGDRSVDVFIRKLRTKIERLSTDWGYIHTHFGIGYRFQPERREGDAAGTPAEHPEST